MKSMDSPRLYLEIGQSSLKALHGEQGLELPLERQENGRLTVPCAERLTLSLRAFLKRHNCRPHVPALCALGARGVSLRRLTLPAASPEELQRLLPLQIEREFPLSPNELAWGCRQLRPERPAKNGAPAVQELLVAAVKKEVLQEYLDILVGCGLSPVFTLAALQRSTLCSRPPVAYAVLDIGRTHSELISFENDAPSSIRLLPWGGLNITQGIEQRLAITHADAETLKIHFDEKFVSNGEREQQIQGVFRTESHVLAKTIQPNWIGQKLYLTGATARLRDFAPLLSNAIGGGVECERVELSHGEGRSAAILGLKQACEENGDFLPLILQLNVSRDTETRARPTSWKWAALAAVLAASSLCLRHAEVFLQKPRLARTVAEIKAYRETLPKIERELSFLQYLRTNQPPYLEPLFALASAAPAGARIETLSMNRHGELSLRAAMRDSQQVVDFRSKLIDSGLFSTVVVEEQTPTPDRQKIVVRITGQWKPNATPPARHEAEKSTTPLKARTNLTNQPPPNIGAPSPTTNHP